MSKKRRTNAYEEENSEVTEGKRVVSCHNHSYLCEVSRKTVANDLKLIFS